MATYVLVVEPGPRAREKPKAARRSKAAAAKQAAHDKLRRALCIVAPCAAVSRA
jgi:hypothetical protein